MNAPWLFGGHVSGLCADKIAFSIRFWGWQATQSDGMYVEVWLGVGGYLGAVIAESWLTLQKLPSQFGSRV